MMLFDKFDKTFLSKDETESVLKSIRKNESATSGEIRIFIESRCPFMDPIERAKEIFLQLKMYNTTDRNAVLIYIAYKDKDFALFADSAIYHKVTESFWQAESKQLAKHFHQKHFLEGITNCIHAVGQKLQHFFPWEGEQKNELPDEIIFGK